MCLAVHYPADDVARSGGKEGEGEEKKKEQATHGAMMNDK